MLAGKRDLAPIESEAVEALAPARLAARYIAVRKRGNLLPRPRRMPNPLVVLAAAKLGTTRLIDNLEI